LDLAIRSDGLKPSFKQSLPSSGCHLEADTKSKEHVKEVLAQPFSGMVERRFFRADE